MPSPHPWSRLNLIAIGLSLGCTGGATDSDSPQDTDDTDDTADVQGCDIDGRREVSLKTRDEVTLAADHYPAEPGRPGLVLLHMHPGNNDRSNWPCDFVEALAAQDWAVIVPDRRGTGGSGGEVNDAFEGEFGRYDVEAAVELLVQEQVGDLAILGASNGTTSQVDYLVWAPGEGLPQAVATGFMSGGGYTENQTDMADVAALGIPAVFTYPPSESTWAEAQAARAVPGWEFFEYSGGDHGTRMFAAAPEVADDLVNFYAGILD
jgi:pimeloyl-ACP methyl ester carboxylesterase